MAKQSNHSIESVSEYDEVDAIMSQLDTNVYVVGENCDSIAMADDQNEMDRIMSQIDVKSLYEQEGRVDTDKEIDTPKSVLSEIQNYGAGVMSSDAAKFISAGVKPLSETLKGLGVQTRRDKENVVLHFGGECKNFTIINLN